MESAPQTPVDIRHNPAASRYEAAVGGQLCVAEYMRAGDAIVFTHTFVPPELRGRGIAEKLVRTALGDARREHLRVVPRCSYVARLVARHPELVERAS